MKGMMVKNAVLVLMLLLVSSLSAQVMLVSKSDYADKKENSTETVYIDKDRLCVESQSANENSVVVYRPGPLFLIMNLDEGTYMEMTEKEIEQMKAMSKQMKAQQKQMAPQMEEARKMMEEQMKNMTPEQRKQMEQYMPKGIPGMGAEPEKTVYKKAASGVKTGSWPCDKYEGYQGDEKVEEVWATDLSNLNISPPDLKVFEEFGKMFEGLGNEKTNAMFKIGSKEFEEEQGYPGVPVKTIRYSGGEVEYVEELVKIERKSGFDDAIFQLRPGLKKSDMMDQMKDMPQMPTEMPDDN
jgi:hypothetical protein